MKRILIAEDEQDIRMVLTDLLRGEGYEVVATQDGEAALAAWRAASVPFDLLLLDVMMPEKSGYDVCREVRATGDSVAVLMLSAKSEEIDKVVGLELGADDYITKPFGVHELLARISAALRRVQRASPSETTDSNFIFCGVMVIASSYQMQGQDEKERIQLTNQEMKLIQIFAAHPNVALSRNRLLSEVWGQDYMGTTRTLDQHVAHLRRKIEALGGDASALVTLHGIGYSYKP